MRRTRRVSAKFGGSLVAAGLVVGLMGGAANGDLAVETIGRVETVPLPYSPHWLFVGDAVTRRTALVDVDDGRLLGMLDSGFGLPQTLHPASRPEIYVIETHYSRGSRGVRTDVLTVYDTATLAPISEVILPAKRALSATPVGHAALSDDDRFAAIFNLTPATSLSIVDLEQRRFVGEIETPGCSLVYPVGPRRFVSLCMNGSLMLLTLDDTGRELSKRRSARFFDPESDPITEKAARRGDHWYFVSYEGWVHPVSFAAEEPVFEDRWSLVSDRERADDWRIGGSQLLAIHRATGRAYALMHQGPEDSHKDAGSEVWVFDIEKRKRLQRIELRNSGFTYLGVPIEAPSGWNRLLQWFGDQVMRSTPEFGIDNIVVTQDDAPMLATSGWFSGGIASYDALTGEFQGRVYSGNMTNVVLQAPWRPPGEAAR
jgi:methylamine dehydrogenase heavy chain